MELIASTVTAIKNAGPRLYAAAFAASAILLFLPSNLTTQIGLADFKTAHLTEIGAAFVISGSLLFVHFLFAVGSVFKKLLKGRRFDSDVRKVLASLTHEEKEFLRRYIEEGTNSYYASFYDGVANGLEAKRIIYRASHVSVPGTPGLLFPYNLQPIARLQLQKNPSYLD